MGPAPITTGTSHIKIHIHSLDIMPWGCLSCCGWLQAYCKRGQCVCCDTLVCGGCARYIHVAASRTPTIDYSTVWVSGIALSVMPKWVPKVCPHFMFQTTSKPPESTQMEKNFRAIATFSTFTFLIIATFPLPQDPLRILCVSDQFNSTTTLLTLLDSRRQQ